MSNVLHLVLEFNVNIVCDCVRAYSGPVQGEIISFMLPRQMCYSLRRERVISTKDWLRKPGKIITASIIYP